jgi:hypothetical protein
MRNPISTDALNAVCPYFTMFPLDFPQRRIKRETSSGQEPVVLDVFCGRGTTLYAARTAGLKSYGIDTSPVAVAIAKAKLASTSLSSVIQLSKQILNTADDAAVPQGDFWRLAYHPSTLRDITRLRTGLLAARDTGSARLLTAIALGALHGPLAKNLANSGYFSNQMPRTYACKPAYAVRYWEARRLKAPQIDVASVIRRRATRIFSTPIVRGIAGSTVIQGDSGNPSAFKSISGANLVITSPPYFGMNTYVEDQWIRNWFLGGPVNVTYGTRGQICKGDASDFAGALAKVWDNVGTVRSVSAPLKVIVRFGGIRSRRSDPWSLLSGSFEQSRHRWRLVTRRAVSAIAPGRRQAEQMRISDVALEEFDATWILN